MINKIYVAMLATLLLASCSLTGGPVQSGETVVRETAGGPTTYVQVLPSKQFWRKPGATIADESQANRECRDQLRLNKDYLNLLEERKPITLARNPTKAQKAQKKEINKRLGQLSRECMESKGFEYVPKGFPAVYD